MPLNHPEATAQALSILRDGSNFQWYVIPIFALVVYVYLHEIGRANWKGVAAGLSLYGVHWLYEIGNALIRHFSGHALWTVPTGTSFLLLVGVGVELSLMFSVAGLRLGLPLVGSPARLRDGVRSFLRRLLPLPRLEAQDAAALHRDPLRRRRRRTGGLRGSPGMDLARTRSLVGEAERAEILARYFAEGAR